MPEPDDMDTATLRRALHLVQQHTGITMPDGKQSLLQTRLRRRMRALGIGSYAHYLQRLHTDSAEVPAFVDVVTTHQTAFFRTSSLWQYVRDTALPEWATAHPGAALRIWSAAASTGEEACTIAMCCDDLRRQAEPDLRWTIQCTDISAAAIDFAREGRYGGSTASQFRNACPALFDRYNASGCDTVFALPPYLRATLQHATHNLLQPCPWPGQFDFVFLRNVLIYFAGDDLRRIVQGALAALRPQGLLLVGEAESLTSMQAPLAFVRPQVYRRLDA
jgi:chemotaxis protein methyltransferase CheR